MIEGPRLAALVSSRICHDMVEPMSAIIQGLDMLKEADVGGRNADALSLLDHGISKVWAKLEFFRFAFAGALVEGDGELSEARDVAERLYSALKPSLVWQAPSLKMPRQAVRVVMNLILIANECLPRGGTVTVDAEASSRGGEVRIRAEGPRAMLKADTLAGLRGEAPGEGFAGHTIQPALTAMLARLAGMELSAREHDGGITLVARSALFAA